LLVRLAVASALSALTASCVYPRAELSYFCEDAFAPGVAPADRIAAFREAGVEAGRRYGAPVEPPVATALVKAPFVGNGACFPIDDLGDGERRAIDAAFAEGHRAGFVATHCTRAVQFVLDDARLAVCPVRHEDVARFRDAQREKRREIHGFGEPGAIARRAAERDALLAAQARLKAAAADREADDRSAAAARYFELEHEIAAIEAEIASLRDRLSDRRRAATAQCAREAPPDVGRYCAAFFAADPPDFAVRLQFPEDDPRRSW